LEFDDAWTRFSEPPEAQTGLPSVFALGFLANQSGAVFGLLDRLLADPATVQVEAIVATADAECLPIIIPAPAACDRSGGLRHIFRVSWANSVVPLQHL
jgi:hypothetical protein